MEIRQYLGSVAVELVHEMQPVLRIEGVAANSDLLGRYTEIAVRRLVRRVVQPMRVSTGAVFDYPMPDKLKQLDTVIWAPFPAPAVFEMDDFALVPRSSAFGVIEIKRTNYSETDVELEDFIRDAKARPIVAESDPKLGENRCAGIGVVAFLEKRTSKRLRSLLEKQEVVAIFEKVHGEVEVRAKDVMIFVNFLQYISWRYRVRAAQLPQIITDPLK